MKLQCGFSGSQKITQVKRYPDYVMYGIRGKAQGFVDEEWIAGVKPIPTLKKKKVVRYAKKKGGTSKVDTRKVVIEGICPVCGSKLPEALTHTWDDYATLEVHCSHCKTRFFCDTNEGAGWSCDITKPSKEIKKPVKPVLKEKKKSKVAAEPKIVELGRDIPRWVKIKNKKYFFSRSFPAKKEADIWAGSIRKDKRLAHVKKHKPFIFYLSSSKTPQRYIVWATSPYEVENPPKLRPAKVTPKKVKKAKPPKPTPTKTAPKKKKKAKTTKTAKTPKKPKTPLRLKTLTDAQTKHSRKHGYVNVTIDGVKKRVTQRNYAPRKRTVQWYRSRGKVCLKVVRG